MRRGERGAASVEAVILVPALLLVVACLVAGARVWFARAVVAEAAQAGARAATLERAPAAGRASASAVVGHTLAARGLACGDPVVSVDTSGFAVAPGRPATVWVEVACPVRLSDLVGVPVRGAVVARGSASSALDTYRRRA